MASPVGPRAVAVVTGAASGIGRATAELLAARGYGVIAGDLDLGRFDWVRDHSIHPVQGDVTNEAANAWLINAAIERFGRLDAVVLNAGLPMSGNIESLDMEQFDRAYQVNVRAVVLGIRAAIPTLRAGGGGSIVITASTSGLRGEANRWAYNTAKAGVVNLARSMAIDLAQYGIRVNTVCPGPTHTGMTEQMRGTDKYAATRRMIPLQRFAEATEVAEAIAFLVSPAASFITGVALPVDGGISAGIGHSLPPEFDPTSR